MKQIFIHKCIIFALMLFPVIFAACNSQGGSPAVPSVPNYPEMVFTSNRGDGDQEIWAWDMDTGFLQLTFNDLIDDKQPALSADRSKIAFVSGSGTIWEIYTMNSDGTGVSSALATLVNSSDGHPCWNPAGTMIAYDSDFDIWTMDADGLIELNRTDTGFDTEIEPAWSPSGTQLAFSRDIAGGSVDYDICTLDPDTAVTVPGITVLTENNTTDDKSPSWSNDSSEIVFSTDRDGDFDIYTMASDGLSQTAFASIVDTTGDETAPAWSADGNSFAYVKGGEDIYTIKSDGSGAETNLTDTTDIDQNPSW